VGLLLWWNNRSRGQYDDCFFTQGEFWDFKDGLNAVLDGLIASDREALNTFKEVKRTLDQQRKLNKLVLEKLDLIMKKTGVSLSELEAYERLYG